MVTFWGRCIAINPLVFYDGFNRSIGQKHLFGHFINNSIHTPLFVSFERLVEHFAHLSVSIIKSFLFSHKTKIENVLTKKKPSF